MGVHIRSFWEWLLVHLGLRPKSDSGRMGIKRGRSAKQQDPNKPFEGVEINPLESFCSPNFKTQSPESDEPNPLVTHRPSSLPQEIWVHIFDLLDSGDDLLSVSSVCSVWKDLIQQNDQLWRNKCLRMWQIEEVDFELCITTWKNIWKKWRAKVATSKKAGTSDVLWPISRQISVVFREFVLVRPNWIHLQNFPRSSFYLSKLRSLFLSDSLLTVLPPQVYTMTNVQLLDLGDNRLVTAPPSTAIEKLKNRYKNNRRRPLSSWTSLQRLDLKRDKEMMQIVPMSVKSLTDLSALFLVGNNLLVAALGSE